MQDRPWSWARGPGLAVILFLVVTAGGTLGYMAIEGWSAWDAFYMTIISVTTVGYREVHPMSGAGTGLDGAGAGRRRVDAVLHRLARDGRDRRGRLSQGLRLAPVQSHA